MTYDPVLDAPIRGARKIAEALKLYDKDGEPDDRAVYYGASQGHYDVTRRGKRTLETTLRRLLAPHLKQDTAA
jgi:hypothetical protein